MGQASFELKNVQTSGYYPVDRQVILEFWKRSLGSETRLYVAIFKWA